MSEQLIRSQEESVRATTRQREGDWRRGNHRSNAVEPSNTLIQLKMLNLTQPPNTKLPTNGRLCERLLRLPGPPIP